MTKSNWAKRTVDKLSDAEVRRALDSLAPRMVGESHGERLDRIAPPRRHLCTACATLVDVTGLVRTPDEMGRPDGYECRVATACAVRAARRERTKPRDAVAMPAEAVVQHCRFCGGTLMRDHALASVAPWDPMLEIPAPFIRWECRSAGACERRMSALAPRGET